MYSKHLNYHGYISLLAGFIIMLGTLFPDAAMALPAFARQTGNECSSCHFQHFPKLKPFGRIFKANGLSLTAQDNIEGQNLSIPQNLNATYFIRAVARKDTSARDGELLIPQEAAILVGGRLAEGVGGMVEWGGPLLSTKLSYTRPWGNNRVGATIFTTDGLGPAYGFEVMNTGAVRNHSPFAQSSNATLGNNDNLDLAGAATGIALFAFSNDWFINATVFAPDSNEAGLTGMDTGGKLSTYLRAAYTPVIKGWDTGIGIGLIGGTTEATVTAGGATLINAVTGGTTAADDVGKINTAALFVDAQLQGQLAGKDLGVYLMYARGDNPTPAGAVNEVNLYGGAVGGSRPTGVGVDIEYSMLPDKLHLLAALGRHDNGDAVLSAKVSAGLGLYWKIAQNISLQPMVEHFGGGQGNDANGKRVTVTSFTLEAGF
jgi:hypothetical protein